MNRKTYSVFLCALLASTFVHDFSIKASPATLPVVGGIINSIVGSTTKLPQHCRTITVCDGTTVTTETPTPSATTAVSIEDTPPSTTPPATPPHTATPPTTTEATTTPPTTTQATTTPPTTTQATTTPPTTTQATTTPPTTTKATTTAAKTTKATTTKATTTKACAAVTSNSSIILTVLGSIKANILGIANIAAKIAFSIDVEGNIIALLNTETQEGIIINLGDNTGVHVTKKDNAIKKGGIKELLQSLTSLKTLLQTKVATKFKVSSASKEILSSVNKILESLIGNLKEELKVHPDVGIKLIVALGAKYVKLLKGDLKGLPKTVGSSAITYKKDLIALTNSLEAIGQIVGLLGGISAIEKAGVKIDLQALANGCNGIDILNILLRGIGTKLDVGKALGGLLNNPETALKLLAQLGGNNNNGVDGLLKVIANTIGLSNKNVPTENLINVLIQFLGANKGKDGNGIRNQATTSINDLLGTLDIIRARDTLKGFVGTLSNLRDHKLQSNGVDVSQILHRLLGGLNNPNLLQVLVSVLVLLVEVLTLPIWLPILLIVLIINANSPLGVSLLRDVGLLLNSVLGGLGSLGGGLLGSLLGTVTNLLGLLLGDLLGALGGIPVIGDLVKDLEKAVGGAGVGGDLRSVLSDSGASNLIKAVLQLVGNQNLGASEESVRKVQEIKNNCGSVNSLLSIDLDADIGA